MTAVGKGKYVYKLLEDWAKLPQGMSLERVGAVATDSQDRVSIFQRKDPPVVVSLADFEGGGRTRIIMADGDVNQLKRGMPLEMSFRKSYFYPSEGITNYYWKSTPVRVE